MAMPVPPRAAQTMASQDDQTPSFSGLEPPTPSPGTEAMRERLVGRMFGEGTQPQSFAHYEIVRRVGAGGMGVVYEARDTKLDRKVALKLVRRHVTSVRTREFARDEARLLAKLSHPNVVQVYEYGDYEGDVYVAMEFVEGETLWSWQSAHPRSRNDIIHCYRQAGTGLAAAHAIGVIHRDFKPTNVLVGRDGRVRVADFGLAIMRDQELEPSVSGRTGVALAGTPGYLAPELRRGASPDERSDQFSFCVALAEALTGVRPGPLTDAGRMRGLPGPSWLRRTIARGLAEQPDARWPSLDALLQALDHDRRTTRRWAGGLVGFGLVAGLGAAYFVVPTGPGCDDPAPRFERVWNPERRAALNTRLAKLGPWAAAIAGELDLRLDAQRRAWLDAAEELCASTSNRAARLPASFDAAARCLERNLAAVDSLLVSLESGDPATLARLDQQLELLDDPSHCLLEPAGAFDDRAPVDGELIDRAELALAAGDLSRADELATQLTRRARLRDEALGLTAGLFVQARVAQANGASVRAKQLAILTAEQARRAGDDETVILARCLLVHICAEHDGDVASAQLWSELADETARDIVPSPVIRIALLQAHARVARAREDFDVAEGKLGEALVIAREHAVEAHRVDDLDTARANVLADAGRRDEALTLYEQLLARRRERLGARHPAVATVEYNLGFTLLDGGEVERAIDHLTRALDIRREVFGPMSEPMRPVLIKRAQAHLMAGQLDEAEADARLVFELERLHLRPHDSNRLDATSLLRVIRLAQGDYVGLHELDELVMRELAEAMSPTGRASLLHELAWVECRLGRPEAAIPHLRAAREHADEVTQLYIELTWAEVELASGEPRLARVRLEQVEPRLRAVADVEVEAMAEWLWLWAKAVRGEDPRAAAEIAADALGRYEGLAPRVDITGELRALARGGE